MIALVRDPRWSDGRAGYGQVAHLRRGTPGELGLLWVSVAPAVSTPMVPLFVGAEDVPPEYKQHRYMTKGADATFLDPEFAPLEATRNAYRTYRRLLYHTCAHPDTFLAAVTAELEAFETARMAELPAVEREATERLRAGDADGARVRLTRHAEHGLLGALELGEALVAAVEREVRERFGIPTPDRPVPEGATWRPESGPMAMPPGADRLHCYVPGLDRYPRPHGSYKGLVGDLIP
jgi:dipeptidase